MSPRHWMNLGLVAVAGAVVGFGLLPQRKALADLRTRLDDVQTAQAQRPADLLRAAPAPKSFANETHSEMTQAEKLEQARLRAEVGRLKERQRALAGAAEENRRLRASQAKSGPHQTTAAAGPPLPAGYLRRAEARLQGYDSPRHTLESFFWAVEQKDTNALFAAVHPEAVERLTAQLERQGTEAGFGEFSRIPGYAVSREEKAGDDETTLWIQFAPDMEPTGLTFQRVDNQWRMRM